MLLLAVFLALASAAPAAPRPLGLVGERDAFALAGDSALVAHVRGRTVRVEWIPVAGGERRTVFRFRAPAGTVPDARLEASAQRAALTILLEDDTSYAAAAQAFSGPPAGGWTPLGPLGRARDGAAIPWRHQLDGDRLFTTEMRGSLLDNVVVVRDPDPHEVTVLSPEEGGSAVFAGDMVAHSAVAPGHGPDEGERRLVVRDWRTGAQHSVADLADPIEALDVRADGEAIASTVENDLVEVPPGGAPRRLARSAHLGRYAGERVVFLRRGTLRVLDPGGRVRVFGIPTETFEGFTTDATRVLWSANGCLLVAPVTAGTAAAPAPGPCPHSEVSIEGMDAPPLRRTIPVRLRCVAAARGGCRGTVRLRNGHNRFMARSVSTRLPFRIPVGRTRTLRAHLTTAGLARLRRQDEPVLLVDVRTPGGGRARGPDIFVRK